MVVLEQAKTETEGMSSCRGDELLHQARTARLGASKVVTGHVRGLGLGSSVFAFVPRFSTASPQVIGIRPACLGRQYELLRASSVR